MSEGSDPRPALPPKLFWRILVAGNITTLTVLLYVSTRLMPVGIDPQVSTWLFLVGIAAVGPYLLYRRHIGQKDMRRSSEVSANARQVEQLGRVVTSLALAELPGLLGVAYYFFSRDWNGAILLLAFAALLTWQTRSHIN